MDKPQDSVQKSLDRAAQEKAVHDKVEGEWQAAFGFSMARYSQRIYEDVEHGLRTGGKLTGERLESEIAFQVGREEKAIRQLDPQEAEVCYMLGVKPSEYVLYKREEEAEQ